MKDYKLYTLTRDGSVLSCENNPENGKSCVLGCFDGVHRGHRILVEIAKTNFFGYTPAVWTFTKPLCTPFIETVTDRLSVCGQLGVELAFCEDFDLVKEMTPEQFVAHLHNDLGVRHFICGRDFKFGIDRMGDSEALKRIAFGYGDCVTVAPPLTVEALARQEAEAEFKREFDKPFEIDPQAEYYAQFGEKVSSTMIREKIAEGDVEAAARFLGRRFGLTAEVCDGKQLGRQMGMPTINQRFAPGRVVPKFGVYYSYAVFDGKEHPAVTNIGCRPTVNSDNGDVTCETHILDCSENLYGNTVRVELCKFAREEQKFDGIDALKSAIAGNISDAKAFFGLVQD